MKTYREFLAKKFDEYLMGLEAMGYIGIGSVYSTALADIAVEAETEYALMREEANSHADH